MGKAKLLATLVLLISTGARADQKFSVDEIFVPETTVRSASGTSFNVPTQPTSIQGVVMVGSKYVDQDSSYPSSKEYGTGSILKIPEMQGDDQFVLTAAHLVSGDHPWINMDGPIQAKDFLIDADNDVALLRVPKTKSEEALKLSKDGKTVSLTGVLRWLDEKYQLPTILAGENDAELANVLLTSWSKAGTEGDQGNPRFDHYDDNHSDLASSLRVVSMGNQVLARVKSMPGQSGGVLYSPTTGKVYGVLSQSSYFFRDSLFSSSESLSNLVQAYRQGKRGSLSDTQFKLKRGMTYRDFGNGISEESFLDRSTGGTFGDPGDTVSGFCKGNVESSISNLDVIQALSQGIDSTFDVSPPDPEMIYQKYGIRSGIEMNGKNVLGFKATRISKNKKLPETLLLAGNAQSIRFLRDHAKEYQFVPLNEGANLLKEIPWKRGKSTIIQFNDNDCLGEAVQKQSSLEIGDKKVVVKLEIGVSGEKRGCQHDEIHLVLDEQGRISGNDRFMPVVRVKGPKSGVDYDLDLSSIFFTDLSQLSVNLPEGRAFDSPISDEHFLQSQEKRKREVFIPVREELYGGEPTWGFRMSGDK